MYKIVDILSRSKRTVLQRWQKFILAEYNVKRTVKQVFVKHHAQFDLHLGQ